MDLNEIDKINEVNNKHQAKRRAQIDQRIFTDIFSGRKTYRLGQ
jgi:hypothetical protein